MKIRNIPIAQITAASYNPRTISASAMAGLKESLRKYGLVDPLIVNVRTNTLVSGHQRLSAAKELEFTHVPVVEVDLSIEEEKALNITLNNQKITGSFTDGLQALLGELKLTLPEFEPLKLDKLELRIDVPQPRAREKRSMIVTTCTPEMRDHVRSVIAQAVSNLDGVEVK